MKKLMIALALVSSTAEAKKPLAPPPVYVPAPIADQLIGDWTVRHMTESSVAYTTNASKSVFGVLCSDTCSAYVNFGKACDDGSFYPAMMNSPGGAANITLRCVKLKDERSFLTFDLTEDLLSSMETGGQIGFAIPLDGGEFNVARFSLTGSLPAVRRIKGPGPADKAPSPKDTTL